MKKNCILFLLFLITITLTGCNVDKVTQKLFYLDETFGGLRPAIILVGNESKFRDNSNIVSELSAITNELDYLYSTTKETSYIKKINDNAGKQPVEVNDELLLILNEAIEASKLSEVDGIALYDITIAPIVDLWDINNKGYNKTWDYAEIPADADIKKLLPLIDYRNIIINEEEKTVFLAKEGMKIDLGSILKGYAADKLKALAIEKGFTSGIINVSGNLLTFGYKDDKKVMWRIGIQTPYASYGDPTTVGYIEKSDITAVSSGIYERYILTKEGEEYHHIFDPRTGYPNNNDLMHVTILTDLSIRGDALSTTIFSLGLEKGYELVESLENVQAIFITRSKKIYVTSGIKNEFVYNEEANTIGYTYKGVLK